MPGQLLATEGPDVKLLAIGESIEHICTRYRVTAFRPHFAHAGFTLDYAPVPQSWLGWAQLLRQVDKSDVVLLQRTLLPAPLLSLLRKRARSIIFDYDDAIWLRDSYAPQGPYSAKRLRRFRATCLAADHIVAGNAFLAEAANQLAGKVFVTVIPTCVDLARYTPKVQPRSVSAPLQFVWVGSSSTLKGLVQAQDYLEAIGQAIPNARLKLVCDSQLSLKNLAVDFVPWSAETEATAIAQADVGIAWMPADDWSRGKCGLKVLQYQAAGLPTLANSVGVHTEFVKNELTGTLADTPEDWGKAAISFSSNPTLTHNLGLKARAQVDLLASTRAGGRWWGEVLARVAPILTRQAG